MHAWKLELVVFTLSGKGSGFKYFPSTNLERTINSAPVSMIFEKYNIPFLVTEGQAEFP